MERARFLPNSYANCLLQLKASLTPIVNQQKIVVGGDACGLGRGKVNPIPAIIVTSSRVPVSRNIYPIIDKISWLSFLRLGERT
ncbi:hypothetical protein J6590_004129, partial [Homalodisca vitripennis]